MDYICSEHHSMLITFNSDRKPHGRLSEWAPLPPFAFFCVIHLHSLQGALVLPHSPDHQQLLTQDSHRRPGSRRGHRRETEPAVHLRGVELESAGGSTRSIANRPPYTAAPRHQPMSDRRGRWTDTPGSASETHGPRAPPSPPTAPQVSSCKTSEFVHTTDSTFSPHLE